MTRNKTVLLCSSLLFLGRATSQEIQDEWEHITKFPQNQRRNQNLGNFKKHKKKQLNLTSFGMTMTWIPFTMKNLKFVSWNIMSNMR